jgi:hypothetical protein
MHRYNAQDVFSDITIGNTTASYQLCGVRGHIREDHFGAYAVVHRSDLDNIDDPDNTGPAVAYPRELRELFGLHQGCDQLWMHQNGMTDGGCVDSGSSWMLFRMLIRMLSRMLIRMLSWMPRTMDPRSSRTNLCSRTFCEG